MDDTVTGEWTVCQLNSLGVFNDNEPVPESESPLGEFIRRQRELQELSMRQLADLVGISNPYLSQIEHGLRAPSARVLEAIAENLDLSADALRAHISPQEDDAEDPAVIAAIRADPNLNARQRQALIEIYESFRGAPRGGQRSGRAAPS
jgi:transcriptional regulator with XRE-family HTH domain